MISIYHFEIFKSCVIIYFFNLSLKIDLIMLLRFIFLIFLIERINFCLSQNNFAIQLSI